MITTKKDIIEGFERLGLRKGDCVAVHSSLKSLGQVEHGAETLIEALLESLGPEGLLLMPAFAQSEDENGDLMPLDPANARIWTGYITEVFAGYPRSCRGIHPMYSITFAGRDAEKWARENERLMFPYGYDQLFRVLFQDRGFILQIGVDDRTNSSIHMFEEIADPPYLQEKKSQSHLTVEAFFALPLEARRESLKHHVAGPERDFLKVTELSEKYSLLKRVQVGESILTLQPAEKVKDVLVSAMEVDPEFLVVKNESQMS